MEANILRILVLLTGVALVAVIMIQQPKEGGMGAFTGGGGGSGASSTVFGAKGSGSFLFRLTAGLVLAFVIFIVSLVKVTNSDTSDKVFATAVAEGEAIPSSADGADTQGTQAGEQIPSAADETPAPADKPADKDIPEASN